MLKKFALTSRYDASPRSAANRFACPGSYLPQSILDHGTNCGRCRAIVPVWIIRIEVKARHRKFPPGLMKASLLVSIKCTAKISRRTRRTERSYWNLPNARTVPCAESTENRCVPSGCHQAASPQRFTDKVTSIPEERQVPQARNIQIVSHVKIGWTTLLTQILWKRLIRFRTWASFDRVSILLAQR